MSIKNDINKILLKKFPHLEVNVVKYSEVKKDNKYFRIDSEPFKRSRLLFSKNIEYIKFSEIAIINPSKSEIYNLDENTHVTFLSMQNLGNGFINKQERGIIKDFIEGYTYFAENDILIAKITPCMEHGKCAIARKLYNGIGFGSTEFNVFRIKDKRFSKEYIFSFLNRENIRQIAADNMVGTSGRQRVSKEFYENLLIPMFSKEFRLEIKAMVKDSHKALENSTKLYKEAEAILYEALGLDAENPLESILSFGEENKIIHSLRLDGGNSKSYIVASPTYDLLKKYKGLNISIRTYKESYLKTGRLDAEYYQVKYDLIENIIKDYYGGYDKLDISEIKDDNFIPNEKEKYRYIELANIINGNITEPSEYLGENLPTRARRKVRMGDLIISSVEGSLSSCALITEEFDNCIVSTGFYVLKSNSINSETLLVIFRSELFQKYLNKFPSGTILSAISKDGLKNILIPNLDLKTQRKIEAKVKQSFELRDKSKELLENAKVKIEEAIINS